MMLKCSYQATATVPRLLPATACTCCKAISWCCEHVHHHCVKHRILLTCYSRSTANDKYGTPKLVVSQQDHTLLLLLSLRICRVTGAGTGYMQSTSRAILALKATFQTPVYPLLDAVRCALNSKIDQELAHLKVSPAVQCTYSQSLHAQMCASSCCSICCIVVHRSLCTHCPFVHGVQCQAFMHFLLQPLRSSRSQTLVRHAEHSATMVVQSNFNNTCTLQLCTHASLHCCHTDLYGCMCRAGSWTILRQNELLFTSQVW